MKKMSRTYLKMIVPLLASFNLIWLVALLTRVPQTQPELILPQIKAQASKRTQPELILPQIKSQASNKWRSSLREFEDRGPSKFVSKLLHLRDELRGKAASAVAAGIDIGPATTTKWQHSWLGSPTDQSIDFLVPFLSPPKTTAADSTTRIILVPSHHGSYVKRQSIRETWKKQTGTNPNSSTTILFVVAHSDCREFNQDMGVDTTTSASPNMSSCDKVDHHFLKLEQEQNHDLLEIPIREDYRRLSDKMLQAYHWAVKTLPNLKWIAKADDDMFVNVRNLEDFLKIHNSEIPTVIGEIVSNSPVQREGKWAEDSDYPNTHYPNWAKGSAGHVLSRATVEYLTKNSESLHRYQGEDTNIGIWLDEATKTGRLKNVTFINEPNYFISYGYVACSKPFRAIMIGHELKPDDQVRCQRKSRNSSKR